MHKSNKPTNRKRGHHPQPDRDELIDTLLATDDADLSELRIPGYELDAWHLGIIATGPKVEQTLRYLKTHLGCELLTNAHGENTNAWLGAPRPIKTTDLTRVLSRREDTDQSFALGEPGAGINGWGLTHQQAREASRVAILKPRRLTWYAENRLLLAGLRNDTLAQSLRQQYAVPLRGQPGLRKALRAYIDTGCSVSSAAQHAGAGRQTITSRIRKAEQLIGKAVYACLAELDLALRLEELDEQHAQAPH